MSRVYAKWIEANRDKLISVSDKIWEFAEIGLEEYKSSELLANTLKDAGFTVEMGVAEMPTAFVASYGSGKPVIAILGEYDALYAAGVFDFETGLRLVQKRGELMSQASGGGMAAVIGLTEEKINEILLSQNESTNS